MSKSSLLNRTDFLSFDLISICFIYIHHAYLLTRFKRLWLITGGPYTICPAAGYKLWLALKRVPRIKVIQPELLSINKTVPRQLSLNMKCKRLLCREMTLQRHVGLAASLILLYGLVLSWLVATELGTSRVLTVHFLHLTHNAVIEHYLATALV